MSQRNAITFISGRLAALVLLLTFQIAAVRLLGPVEYGHYALVFAWATLFQSVLSFGVPRIIPKYFSQAGWKLERATVRKLGFGIVLLRVGVSALLVLAGYAVGRALGWVGPTQPALLVVGLLYILVSIVQVDADAMAQALALQSVSRTATVGEAAVRLALVGALAMGDRLHGAAGLLAISTLTAAGACAVLLRAVMRTLPRFGPPAAAGGRLDRREFAAIAFGGYVSGLAWFASSPAVVRLIAGRMLDAVSFAGFSFAQTLVLSFQRYTPGSLLFPFIEPNVMAHHARTGDSSRLQSALSLVIKIDLVLIGATVVGTIVAGQPLVELITGGRYGAYAYALPWLLSYGIASSAYRAFEIVAVALGASATLVWPLAISLAWLAIAIPLTLNFGLVALLVCPLGDTLCRLALMRRTLARVSVLHRIIDVPAAAAVIAVAAASSIAGLTALRLAALRTPLAVIAVGTAAGILYLGILAAVRPFRVAEIDLVLGAGRGMPLERLRRFARV